MEPSNLFTDFDLDSNLIRAVDCLGLQTPTPIQNAMLPEAMAGRDIQARAETGSGKTAAFLLPVCHRLLQEAKPDTATRCLILSPTRELAEQIYQHFKELAQFTFLRAELVLGGHDMRQQMALIRKNPEILIATPGRLLDHVKRQSVELQDLEMLVLDEADRMLDMGLRETVMAIVETCNSRRQSILLSATLNHAGIGRIAGSILQNPAIISLGDREQPASIRQQVILADDNTHKRQLLDWLLGNESWDKALIFTNTRESAEALAADLRKQRAATAVLHGELSREQRNSVMQSFRDGKFTVLVATDLAARGLDIAGVELVVNFALARSGDEYLHRIGRTGRAGKAGLAISLISAQEWNRLGSIERYLDLSLERREVKALPARFQGLKRKKKKSESRSVAAKNDSEKKLRPKNRWRDKKNIGKRRKSGSDKTQALDGFAPLKKKK